MSFDKIIANFPYSGNLHLKILREAMKHIEKEGGEIVSLEPDDFMRSVTSFAIKDDGTKGELSNVILPQIYDYENIPHRDANEYFGLGNGIVGTLGIFVINNKSTCKYANLYKPLFIKLDKLFSKENIRKHFVRIDRNTDLDQKIFRYHYEYSENDEYWWVKNIVCTEGKAKEGIHFSSALEKNNFIESLKTWPYKLAFKLNKELTNIAHLPFLPTYKKQWTDADLFAYFKLNKDERKIIEEEMK